MNFDELGIVVVGRNEGQRLIDCLNSLKPHTDRTVYVDSGSSDGSASAAQRAGFLVVQLDPSQAFTAARARNEGFARLIAAKPDIQFVQFIDGDCELVPTRLEVALLFPKSRNDVAVVCGRRRERYPEESIYNHLCDMEWNTPIGEALACGGDALIRVDAFREVNGFRSSLIAGEEPELCARLRERGWKVWRLDAEMTRHDAAMTRFHQWWRRAVRSGYAEAESARLHLSSGDMAREKRAVASAVVWAGLLPIIILIASLLNSAFLALAFVYVVQLVRIAVRKGATAPESWAYAAFVMIAKFAELQGIARYIWNFLLGKTARTIEYK